MDTVSINFDVEIRVVFPYLTKSLPTEDKERINATGNFNFEPAPQVDTTKNVVSTDLLVKEVNKKDRIANIKDELGSLLFQFDKIQEVMKKKASHITLKYDPEVTENESLASAERDVFGYASGEITYKKFEEVLSFQEKINKYISHLSVENNGRLANVA